MAHLADWVNVSQLVTTLVALVALWFSYGDMRNAAREARDAALEAIKAETSRHYTELDRLYMDILAMRVERPYLGNPDAIVDARERAAYDAHAYIVWNFIETIHDRATGVAELARTWLPVVDYEAKLHAAWIADRGNALRFKEPLRAKLLAGPGQIL